MTKSAYPIILRPGVVKTEADRIVEGRYIDSDKVRFSSGLPEKIGGWTKLTSEATEGKMRSLHAWRTTRSASYLAAGTFRKLFIFTSGYDRHDITPLAATGQLTDPFSTVDTSNVVTVAHATHGRREGDLVIFDNATAVGGITIDGEYIVSLVTGTGTYEIVHSAPATSTVSGGGGTVDYEYELSVGVEYGTLGFGYGVGGYGLDPYGTQRAFSTFVIEARLWSLDNFGEDLIAAATGTGVYAWDASATLPLQQRAAIVSQSPTDVRFVFVTAERFVVALRENLVVSWCSQANYNVWTPAADNTANTRTLGVGNKLVAGAVLGPSVSIIWSDAAAYILQFTGSKFVHDTRLIGRDCGLAAQNAQVTVNGIAYWFGSDGFFMYAGSVQKIPNQEDIRDFVFDNMREDRSYHALAVHNVRFGEIWFMFTAVGENDPGIYLIYNYEEQHWTPGTLDRVAGTHFQQSDTRPIMAGHDGHLYYHEDGHDADGAVMRSFIESGKFAVEEGQRLIGIEGFVPDFYQQAGQLDITILGYDRLRDAAAMDSVEMNLSPTDALMDVRFAARYAGLIIESEALGGFFRMGKPVFQGKVSGARR